MGIASYLGKINLMRKYRGKYAVIYLCPQSVSGKGGAAKYLHSANVARRHFP